MWEVFDVLGAIVKKWDAVLQRPGRWGWLAVAVSIVIGVTAGATLWLPGNRTSAYHVALIVLALAGPQLFFRVHGPAVLTAAAMIGGIAASSALWGGYPLDLATALLIVGAAVIIELVNAFGKSPRWTLGRGVRGVLLGGLLFLIVPFFFLDYAALQGFDNPADIAVFLAYAVTTPMMLAFCVGIYAGVRIVLGAVLTAIADSRNGSVVPSGE